MSDSPAVILYDANGNEVTLENGQIPPVNNKAVPIAGTDGTNARHVLTDSTGKLLVSGSFTATNPSVSTVGNAVPSDATFVGFSNGTNLKEARVYDLDNSIAEENVLGVNLRASGPSGSVEVGTSTNPLPVSLTSSGNINSKLSVSDMKLLRQSSFPYKINNLEYSTNTASSGTVTYQSDASARMLASTSATSSAELRTNSFFKLPINSSIIIRQTILHNDLGQTNQERRWGIFDNNDGIFFRLNGTTKSVSVMKTSSITTNVLFSSFNYDVFDGTGPSGFNLDITKVNSYEIKYFWNGCGILEFYVNGYLGHRIENFNLSTIFTRTISLPLSYKINNTAITTSSSFKVFSSSIHTDSDVNNELTFSAYLDTKNISTTEVPLLSIRASSLFNSLTNRIISMPKKMFVSTENNRIKYKLVFNPTLTASSFSAVDSDSSIEYDISATSYSGGTVLFFGSFSNTTSDLIIDIGNFFDLYERAIRLDGFATSSSILSIVAANTVAGNARVRSSLTWNEVQ